MEDKYKPTFTSHPADLAKMWATSEEEAHATLHANLKPEVGGSERDLVAMKLLRGFL